MCICRKTLVIITKELLVHGDAVLLSVVAKYYF